MPTHDEFCSLRLELIDHFRAPLAYLDNHGGGEEDDKFLALSESAWNFVETHGWDYINDEDWLASIHKASTPEILAYGLGRAILECRPQGMIDD